MLRFFEWVYSCLDIQWKRFNIWLDVRKENPGKKCSVVYDKERNVYVSCVQDGPFSPGELEEIRKQKQKEIEWARRLWTPEQHEQERRRLERIQAVVSELKKDK